MTTDLFELLGGAFSLVFIFWPLIMLGALRGRGRLLPQMLVIWSFLAVGRLLLSSNPILFSSFIIPEPYNTRAAGHKARRTGAIGDHGVEVIVQAKNGEKWLIQCKRWRGAVGEPVVRDLYGVLHHEKADRAAIITTGQFTESAQEWAKGKPIALYDGDQFLRSWKRIRGQR
jgi:hypothetical protein